MGPPALRPLSNLEILDGAFTLYRRNFVPLVGAAFVLSVPAVVLFLTGSPLLSALVNFFATFATYGALVRIAADATLGTPVNFGGALRVGLRKTLPLLINYMIFGILVGFGMLALIVGGILVLIMGFAIAQVVVIENRWDGFARSRLLAKNAWGRISILMLLSWIITFLPVSVLYGGTWFAMIRSGVDPEAATVQPNFWVNVAGLLIPSLLTPFTQCVLTLLYFDQRVRKEGLGIEMQAAALQQAG